MSFNQRIKILESKGFKEQCPTRNHVDYFKFPFLVRVYFLGGCQSWRTDTHKF